MLADRWRPCLFYSIYIVLWYASSYHHHHHHHKVIVLVLITYTELPFVLLIVFGVVVD